MPDGVFEVAVVTPEAELLHTEAKALVLRSSDGDLTVLDGHTPLITDVVPGDVRVDRPDGDPVHLAVHGGYLQVETAEGVGGAEGRATRATLLAGVAELAGSIDTARARQALAAAEARAEELRAATGRSGAGAGGGAGAGDVQGATQEELELAIVEAALRRAQVRLEVSGTSD